MAGPFASVAPLFGTAVVAAFSVAVAVVVVDFDEPVVAEAVVASADEHPSTSLIMTHCLKLNSIQDGTHNCTSVSVCVILSQRVSSQLWLASTAANAIPVAHAADTTVLADANLSVLPLPGMVFESPADQLKKSPSE